LHEPQGGDEETTARPVPAHPLAARHLLHRHVLDGG